MALLPPAAPLVLIVVAQLHLAGCILPQIHAATTRFYDFNVHYKNVSKLCRTTSIVAVNGRFPGPTIYAQEGDRVIVKVTNSVKHNVTLHWHGVRQVLSCWFDGPAYVTQCPIGAGATFTYEFTLERQKGTLWWHAHVNWLRATVHGPIIIYPKQGVPYPFPFPHAEHVIILGEFWHEDASKIQARVVRSGGGPPNADAFVINGHPGPLYQCSSQDTYHIVNVVPGRTYLLRLISAALNNEHFFSIAEHNMTVVEADGEYTMPYTTRSVAITPGQTLNVLVTANAHPINGATAADVAQPADQDNNHRGSRSYYMGMSVYSSNANVPFLRTPALAIWRYIDTSAIPSERAVDHPPPVLPDFPAHNDTAFVAKFATGLRSFSTVYSVVPVPRIIDRHLFFTIGLNEESCSRTSSGDSTRTANESGTAAHHATGSAPCEGPNGGRFSASINNITFRLPRSISLLQAYHDDDIMDLHSANDAVDGRPAGHTPRAAYYTTDFPDRPLRKFDYVQDAPNNPPVNTQSLVGTRLDVIDYNANVQIVLQNTGVIGPENHPVHLHGFSFYVVASGSGDYNPATVALNLHDPPLRNTIGVPVGGWAVIRFQADNPGVWYLHCHLEIHTTWGLSMAFIVKNGKGSAQTLPQPPADLPQC